MDNIVECVVANVSFYCQNSYYIIGIPTIVRLPPQTATVILNAIVSRIRSKNFNVSFPFKTPLTPYVLGVLLACVGWQKQDKSTLQCAASCY